MGQKEQEKGMVITKDIVTPLLSWYQENKRILPWRENKEPYRVWVSEIMLQQTRVEAVKPYFDRFMKALPTVDALAMAEEERLLKLWEGLGYYNRAKNLQKAARIIMDEYEGRFPNSFQQLIALPGIGAYTAGAIASISFEQPVPAVDGNVLRILSRLLCYEEDVLSKKARDDAADALSSLMPRERSGDFNQALMELGATVCLPNGMPKCEGCPWQKLCLSYEKGCFLDYPKKSPKKSRKVEKQTVLVIGDGKKLLLHKRQEKGLLSGMYELPMLEGHLDEQAILDKVRDLGFSPIRIRKTNSAKHIFTHKEWHMEGYCILTEPEETLPVKLQEDKGYVFASLKEVKKDYPIPSAFDAFREYFAMYLFMREFV